MEQWIKLFTDIPKKSMYLLNQGRETNYYLQDRLIDKIVAPLFPITSPIFPWGISRTERISSLGSLPSAFRLSTTRKKDIL